jgi:transposase
MGNRRFEMHQYRHILFRMRSGESDRQIAKAGLMGRPKARELRSLAETQGWLDPREPLPDDATLAQALGPPASKAPSPSLVLPYADEVRSWWEKGIQGTTIHEALVRKYDFPGHYSSVRRFLQTIEKSTPRPTVMLDFEPAEAAQVDFGSGPLLLDPRTGKIVRSWFFVMTLCWSRHQYLELVPDQSVATWLSCFRRAFEWFTGVVRRVIIDNPKCAITRACFYDPEVQRSFADFAEGYGFLISPCPPADPEKKGIVESGVKYAKKSFLPLRKFRDFLDANAQAAEWVLGPAGNRIHGTTKERPLTRFAQVERYLLKPLPPIAPEIAIWRQVTLHPNCHVRFEQCFYSAPFRLIGEKLWLRATPSTVQLFHHHELVAVHPRCLRPGGRRSTADHMPPEAVAYLMRDPQWCLTQAQTIGPNASGPIGPSLAPPRVCSGSSLSSPCWPPASLPTASFPSPRLPGITRTKRPSPTSSPSYAAICGLRAISQTPR